MLELVLVNAPLTRGYATPISTTFLKELRSEIDFHAIPNYLEEVACPISINLCLE